MEARARFHGIYSGKLQLIEEMEASTSTDSGKVHAYSFVEASTNFNGSKSA